MFCNDGWCGEEYDRPAGAENSMEVKDEGDQIRRILSVCYRGYFRPVQNDSGFGNF
jgi:hypothetical protein